MKTLSLVLIKLYQKFLSPDKLGLGSVCRYSPTCSEYTFQAITKYGVLRGWTMGFSRLLRCHPLAQGGYDPLQ